MTTTHLTDEEIASHLSRRFDKDLWQTLFARYEKPLQAFIRRYVPSHEAAQDIFQETFMRVYRNLAVFDPERRFKTWCYTIALNLCRSLHRRRLDRSISLERAASDDGDSLGDRVLVDYDSDPERLAALREDRANVRRAVALLPQKQHEVFTLYYYQGLPYEEIARAINRPVGTVKSRMHTAMRMLKTELSRLRAVTRRMVAAR
ncbi:MAG: sigma-70 family RNA polymerase sigma factor [Planctomycetes bacterium]|nr:sigma-70 family RNA polymerase sigma factor [Planctomycetota bacterium]